MSPRTSRTPGIWPALWADALRDRLQFFRLLCLVLALVTLSGIVGILAVRGAPRVGALTVVAGVIIAASWIAIFRTRRPAVWMLVIEAPLFVLMANEVHHTRAVFAIMYLGLQYRAMFGSRAQAATMTVVYGLALLAVHAVVPGGMKPSILGEITVGAFGAFIMHTLSEVLSRDAERTSDLMRSEQRLRLIAENLREALVRTDVMDTITFVNARAGDLFGYAPDELIGMKAAALMLPEVAAGTADRLKRRLAGQAELYETVLVRKDGTRICAEVSAGPYREASGVISGTIAAISDISDRKDLEERLHQSMRLESVGQLAGGVAHDFNNLLTVIQVHTEMLLADLPAEDPARESILEIGQSAARAAVLTQQLLAFGQRQFLQPLHLRLGDIVAGAMPRLRRFGSQHATLQSVDDGSPDIVFADPMRIEHVLSTLVRNAAEAMPGGGQITLTTRTVDVLDDHALRAAGELPTGRFALLTVADSGIGIAPEAMGRLFQPFYTTKPFGEGTGLGLASVYGIVRQSAGYIHVESEPGKGTSFHIYLPLATPASAVLPVAKIASPAGISFQP
jgi:PAS domain S-box-containing protein